MLLILRPGTDQPAPLTWGINQRIELAHIQPGKPVQNAYAERFNGRFRDECLNVSWFQNLWDGRRKIAAWRVQYNFERPLSSLDYPTPEEFVAAVVCSAGADYAYLDQAVGGKWGHVTLWPLNFIFCVASQIAKVGKFFLTTPLSPPFRKSYRLPVKMIWLFLDSQICYFL
jgi:hypothetical protein